MLLLYYCTTENIKGDWKKKKKKRILPGVFQLLEPITSTDWVASFKLLHQKCLYGEI